MTFSTIGALGAGLMAAVVTIAVLYVAMGLLILFSIGFSTTGMITMNVLRYLGLVAGDRHTLLVYLTGVFFFLALGCLFGLAHAGFLHAFEVEADLFVWGLLLGMGHWLLDGLALGFLARRHPALRSGQVSDPGPFMLNLSASTSLAFLAMHLLFGMFVAAFYDAFR